MRVIAGTARSVKLAAPKGIDTRPTTDQIKETLFNILSPWLDHSTRFLDLFSGSGAIAIEALSRGAKEAVLVERDRRAVRVIHQNLTATRLGDRADVLAMDAADAVRYLSKKDRRFDVIFLDAPYGSQLPEKILALDEFRAVLAEDPLIIIEEAREYDADTLSAPPYRILRQKIYKTNQHLFLTVDEETAERKADGADSDLPREL